ncbi:nudix hydrolase 14, chloroplastic isoform X2 [Mangifera indica]|uniref:nudix hydrolase 14, chloroplastic isoform X2 n=1 Tax=Mangifera indica TaxID=29780 RepID=UPI001CF97519|nr:nudix hydrolase 14, chloroplastic isoform X2 [Mangifera indica]
MSQLIFRFPKLPAILASLTLIGATPAHRTASIRTTRTPCSMMPSNSSPSLLTHSITLPCQLNQPVHVVAAPGLSETEFRSALDSNLFNQWLKNLQGQTGILAGGDMLLKQVLIQGVDMFGKRIGFLKFRADIFNKATGKKGSRYSIRTRTSCGSADSFGLRRVPTGRLILELPAGMLDDDKGDFVGTAIREVEEEVGINLNMEDVVDLTAFLDPSTGGRVFPSPGGCDEEISLFLYRGSVGKEVITQLQGKETGLREHGELIKVCVVPYRKLWQITPDAKVLTAIALYEMAQREGLLPVNLISKSNPKG